MQKVYKDQHDGVYVIPDGANVTIQADWVEVTNQAEIDAIVNPTHTPEQIYAAKWALVDEYEATLEVTLANGHRYAANADAQRRIQMQIDTLPFDATITWIETWGTFTTNAIELKQALIEAQSLVRAYTNLTFGV